MFRHHLGALTLLAAFVLPLTASAQTLPAPGAVAPAASAPTAHHYRHHRNRFVAALRGLQLSDGQKQQIAGIMKAARTADQARARALRAQIEGVLTADQRTQLRTQLAREPRRAEKPEAPAAPR